MVGYEVIVLDKNVLEVEAVIHMWFTTMRRSLLQTKTHYTYTQVHTHTNTHAYKTHTHNTRARAHAHMLCGFALLLRLAFVRPCCRPDCLIVIAFRRLCVKQRDVLHLVYFSVCFGSVRRLLFAFGVNAMVFYCLLQFVMRSEYFAALPKFVHAAACVVMPLGFLQVEINILFSTIADLFFSVGGFPDCAKRTQKHLRNLRSGFTEYTVRAKMILRSACPVSARWVPGEWAHKITFAIQFGKNNPVSDFRSLARWVKTVNAINSFCPPIKETPKLP